MWEASFDFYEGTMGDARAMVWLDLAAARHAPVSTHPVLLKVRIKMLKPRADGLRSAEEADALFELEDLLEARLSEETGALYVGRVVAKGYTEFHFYGPLDRRTALAAPPSALLPVLAPYQPEWATDDDPNWEKYEALYPNAWAMQRIKNRRLLAAMTDAGDQLHLPRLVDHVVSFPSQSHAQTAADSLKRAGYTIDPIEKPESTDDGWRLEFHRIDSCDQGKADGFTDEILEIVLPLDGDYDGWGSPVQTQ